MNISKKWTRSRLSLITLFSAVLLFGAGCGTVPDGGVFVTEDIAGDWEQKVFVGQDGRKTVSIGTVNVEKVELDPTTPDTMYLATTGNGIWKTTTAGAQWYQLPVSPDRVRDIEIHPQDPNIVYSVKNANIIKSSDGGEQQWEIVYTDAQNAIITRIEIDWFNPNRVLAVTSIGTVLLTEDDGATWKVVHQVDEPIIGLHMSEQDSRVMYIHELDRGIHKSTNGGTEWVDLFDESFFEEHRKSEQVKHVAVDPNNHNTVYSVSQQGILRSTDGGSTWSLMTTLIEQGVGENAAIKNITILPGDSNTIIFTIGRLIYRTTDGGSSWESIESFASGRNITQLVVHPENTAYIIAGTQEVQDGGGGLFIGPQ